MGGKQRASGSATATYLIHKDQKRKSNPGGSGSQASRDSTIMYNIISLQRGQE